MWLIQRGLAGSTMLAAMLSGDCANLQGIASCQVRHWRRVLAAVHVLKESSKTGRDALLRASSPGAVAPLTTRCSACVESVADVRRRWATSSQQCRRQPSQAACTRCIGIVDSSCSACDLCTQFLLCQARRRPPARCVRSGLVPCTTKATSHGAQVRAADTPLRACRGWSNRRRSFSPNLVHPCSRRLRRSHKNRSGKPGQQSR